MGVLILGTLSGFGAVRNASVLIASIQGSRSSRKGKGKMKSVLREEDVTHAEGSLRRVRLDLVERRAQIGRAASTSTDQAQNKGVSQLIAYGSL